MSMAWTSYTTYSSSHSSTPSNNPDPFSPAINSTLYSQTSLRYGTFTSRSMPPYMLFSLPPSAAPVTPPPGVADLLSQHFPYLNLYHPFVTAYPTVMATLDNFTSPLSVSYSQHFAEFIKAQQQDPRCRPFGLRDWLLTLIQRCPRYELLLRDHILHTDSSDPEYQALQKVLMLVTKSVFLFTLPSFATI